MSTFKPTPPVNGRAKCENCGHECHPSQCGWIQHAEQRLTAGEEVPVGECPECGCCAYLVKPKGVGEDRPETEASDFNLAARKGEGIGRGDL